MAHEAYFAAVVDPCGSDANCVPGQNLFLQRGFHVNKHRKRRENLLMEGFFIDYDLWRTSSSNVRRDWMGKSSINHLQL